MDELQFVLVDREGDHDFNLFDGENWVAETPYGKYLIQSGEDNERYWIKDPVTESQAERSSFVSAWEEQQEIHKRVLKAASKLSITK